MIELSQILASFTLIAIVGLLCWFVMFFLARITGTYDQFQESALMRFIGRNGVLFAFIVALGATVMSLYYSEIRGFTPCKLCWIQRIFIYPQVIILGIALWKGERHAVRFYSGALAILGICVSLFHYYLQQGGTLITTDCSILGSATESCSKILILHYGFITFPLMALVAGILIYVCMAFLKETPHY